MYEYIVVRTRILDILLLVVYLEYEFVLLCTRILDILLVVVPQRYLVGHLHRQWATNGDSRDREA